jgi:tetratricopeptide (TPR) repeat protein
MAAQPSPRFALRTPRRARPAVLALLLALAAATTGAQPPAGPGEAQALLDGERWSEAAGAFEAWLADHPDDAPAWLGLGTARLRQGQYQGALDAFGRARELGLAQIPLDVRAAIAAAALDRRDVGLDWVKRALADGLPLPVLASSPSLEPLRSAMAGHPPFDELLAEAERQAHPCRHGEAHRQLDFWLGRWEVESSGTVVGTNHIEAILDGCVLLEQWSGGGIDGKSFNFYDAAAQEWRQLWVDGVGASIDYRGGFQDGAMRFAGTQVRADGTRLRSRMTLTPHPDGTVHQLIERSADDGATWQVAFDGLYRKAGG